MSRTAPTPRLIGPRACALGLAVVLAAGAGCAEVACEEREDVVERDMCVYDALVADPPPTADDAMDMARRIEDPIVRGAAVGQWLRSHPRAEPSGALQLCGLLEGPELLSCRRRVESPHLHR
jgi:hypothetical protein